MAKPKTKSQMGKAAREKGKVGEREVATLLKQFGFNARRGQQFCGRSGDADVTSDMEGFHIEVKRTETFAMYPALEQAAGDAKDGATPIVFHRRNAKDWVVVMDAEAFLALMRDYVYE